MEDSQYPVPAEQGADERYEAFFEQFNQQAFYEAHEVLERLWLEQRPGAQADFYKGLIQLAGAFVHLQKSRPGPAMALLSRSRDLLRNYAPANQRLDVRALLTWMETLLAQLREGALPKTILETKTPLRLWSSGCKRKSE